MAKIYNLGFERILRGRSSAPDTIFDNVELTQYIDTDLRHLINYSIDLHSKDSWDYRFLANMLSWERPVSDKQLTQLRRILAPALYAHQLSRELEFFLNPEE